MWLATKHRSLPGKKRDAELERYFPGLEQELRECLDGMKKNNMMFNLETEPELIEQRIYEGEALRCRYEYLMRRARAVGLHAIL